MAMIDEVPGRREGAFSVVADQGDLKRRIVSGVVLVGIAAAALIFGQLSFGVLAGVISVIVAWEWSRLVRGPEIDAALVVHAAAAMAAGVLAGLDLAGLAALVIACAAIVVSALALDRRPILSLAGVLLVGLAAVTLVWIRSDEPHGLLATALVMLVAAACDTFSFVTGKIVGGPRLWPSVSPNKTWAGLVGGIVASGAVAAAFAAYAGLPVAWLTAVGIVLGIGGQAGDLCESALKRSFKVKDASGLIPGHGGFMDRLDSLVVAALIAGLLALTYDPSRPAAVLIGA
ncbi:MAG: phosphatidate cytidylyltransferase [Hyphomicrobium sp.]|nr:phosphatidate cytidylyltransferase [Hyphomicrobium sp.]